MLVGAALVVGLSVVACGSSAATVAPPPATPTMAVTDTPAPTDTTVPATPSPTPMPTATPTAAPSATPAATPTPTPAATPTPSGTASASVTPLPSASCTGGASTKQWLADQMPHFKFKLYCAVMPSGWSLVGMSSDYDVPGLQAHYKNKTGGTVDIWEGNVCGLSPNPCSGYWPQDLGTLAFGPLTGTFTGDTGSEAWSNVVTTTSPTIRYVITGSSFEEAPFKSISAAMHPLS